MGEELAGTQEGEVVEILKRIAKQKEIFIEFDRGVLARSVAQRRCVIPIEEENTLDAFLRESVPAAVSWLQISYEFDRVAVSLKGE